MNLLNTNPVFLFILFAMGYVFGLLLKKPTAGKFLIFGFFGIFIYEPVKDAGLLASAAFVFGLIVHHINLLSIFESYQLYRDMKANAQQKKKEAAQPESEENKRPSEEPKKPESAEETHRKYEEFVNNKRKKDETKAEQQSSRSKKHKSSNDGFDKQREALRKEQERLRREKERVNAEREKFRKEQQAAHSAPDTRTHEEVLGLTGSYTLDDLKKARRREVERWNTSNMVNKPAHLVKQAEEEMKMINLAFDALKKKL